MGVVNRMWWMGVYKDGGMSKKQSMIVCRYRNTTMDELRKCRGPMLYCIVLYCIVKGYWL